MKPIRILGRSISSAFKSVVRNFSLSVASISCIIITLIIVSFAILLSVNVNNFTKSIESDLTIVVFAKEGTVKENVDTLKKEIDSIPNVVDIEYKSKEDLKNERPYYLVVSHLEPDHSANIEKLSDKYPEMKIILSQRAAAMLPQFINKDLTEKLVIVKEAEEINLGKHTLQFLWHLWYIGQK